MRLSLPPLLAGILLFPGTALAQRTDDNAVRAAQDGFGFSVGNEEIGIYSIGSVRGFSPLDAGNVRLNDIYIDIRGDFPDAIEQGSMVKVGITAIRTPLLAPSGVGEIALKQIDGKPVSSLGLSFDDWGSAAIEGETRLGRRDGLSLVAAGRIDAQSKGEDGSRGHGWNFGVVPRWQVGKDSHIQAYVGFSRWDGQAYGPGFYTDGAHVPVRPKRRRAVQQDWNRNGDRSSQAGIMADIALGQGWRARGGLFRGRSTSRAGVFEYITDIDTAGLGLRNAILSDRYDVGSWSGEGQLVRTLKRGDWHGELMAAVRFRRVTERSGAGQSFELDSEPVPVGTATPVGRPVRIAGPRDRSEIRQVQPGLSARVSWKDLVALNLGVQKADYSKHVDFAGGGATRISSKPMLWNAGLAVSPTATLTLYAGMARGLEEAGVAPDIAANARAALPAAITRQKDVGLSWKPSDSVSLIAGAFSIRRPYANIDRANVFRFLGALRNEGVEVSLVTKPAKGLNLVAGAIRQWPRLSGEEVATGLIGRVPVAYSDYTANLGADYQIPYLEGLSANASLYVVGPREARVDGSLKLPQREVLGLGMRYRFRKAGTDWVVNLNVNNVLDSYDWSVGGDGGFYYTSPRAFRLSLFADF